MEEYVIRGMVPWFRFYCVVILYSMHISSDLIMSSIFVYSVVKIKHDPYAHMI